MRCSHPSFSGFCPMFLVCFHLKTPFGGATGPACTLPTGQSRLPARDADGGQNERAGVLLIKRYEQR